MTLSKMTLWTKNQWSKSQNKMLIGFLVFGTDGGNVLARQCQRKKRQRQDGPLLLSRLKQVNNSATVPSNSGIPLHEEGRNELYVSGKRCLQASDLKAAISGEFAQRSKSWTTDEGEAYNGTRLAMRCDLMTILERVTQCPFVNCPHPPAPKVTPH